MKCSLSHPLPWPEPATSVAYSHIVSAEPGTDVPDR